MAKDLILQDNIIPLKEKTAWSEKAPAVLSFTYISNILYLFPKNS